jgi:hypothetical protein
VPSYGSTGSAPRALADQVGYVALGAAACEEGLTTIE